MPTFRLIVEYDGTDFEGWQDQPPPHRTVQGCIADAIRQVTGVAVRPTGSGRTDSGVHAAGQVASVRIETDLDPDVLRTALNATLAGDVAIRSLARVADDFDARRNARSKLYRYVIWNAPARSPLRERFALWVREPLDLAAMRAAAAPLCGTHDFSSFQASGSAVGNSVRCLDSIEIRGNADSLVEIDFDGRGFLRHMVRNLVGTLLEVGRGARPASEVAAVLAARDRSAAGPTAPARGLTLLEVRY